MNVSAIRKNLLVSISIEMRFSGSDKLVHPSGDPKNHNGADNRRTHNGYPLVPDYSEATHKPDTGGNKKESKVMHHEIRSLVNLRQFDQAALQRTSKQNHAYDA